MKSSIVIFRIILCAGVFAAATAGATGFDLKPYGYVKAEMTYASHGVLSTGKPGLSAPQLADTLKGHSFGVSVQSTRLGMKGWMTADNGMEVGGKVEGDFSTSTGNDASAKPRLRLAYAWIATHLAEIRVGQQWDLFSSQNPTMSTGASGLWYAGNLGTRRGQFQCNIFIPENYTAPILSVALCEGAKETDGLGADNFSSFPMVQARGSIEVSKKYLVGLSLVHANFDPDPSKNNDEYTTLGYGVDYDLRFHKLFSIRGEVNMGKNLANGNFSTIAGAGKHGDTRENSCFWANIVSKPLKHLNVSLGGGMDQNKSDHIAAAAATKNTIMYGEFIFPLMNGLSVETEVGSIHTLYKERASQSAMFTNLAGKLEF
ncbi:MAG TPA: porin [bacterium]|jgi:hypothetical protein